MAQALIIALGASAGGIQALAEFFENLNTPTGDAYVVILHLSPNHDSRLAQVLQQATSLPVTQVVTKTLIEPDHVYVIPPDQHLTLEDGHIVPSSNIRIEERRAPIDIFFRSLAEAHRNRAVGVVLSGTGANGSMGLKRIKEMGGVVFVQNPREAEFNEMPRNAISTDLVDDVLNVAGIPARIRIYRGALEDNHIQDDPDVRIEDDQRSLRDIFTQLRLRTGHDFTNYKRATLMRRIARRMAIRGLTRLPDYAGYSNQHPEETQALLKDLLISVTNFFRDKSPFNALEDEILPEIFAGKSAGEQVRIWVAGCATGEEAYTIAMLCAERTLGVMDAPKIQIFATDIDEAAIATGREGFYTLNDAADISTERLNRFFIREGEGYRIRREIRETILFANHNFLKDPPFSRIDLVSCRNVLIYLNRIAQERVMETFHLAMRPGGFLLLGTSESVDTASDLFRIFNREQHIYQARGAAALRSIVVPETVPQLRAIQPAAPPAQSAPRSGARINFGALHLQLIEEYAPPSLVVNADFDIVHLSAQVGLYLKMTGGELSSSLLKLIRDELRTELRNALYQAGQKAVPVTSVPISVRTDDGARDVRIHVRPLAADQDAERGYLLVVFEPAGGEHHQWEIAVHTTEESATRQLEEDLARLRVQLRASNEHHEFQAEELKAGNEELQAMNEELRSATEELETSKEELQSINEELSTVNQELKVKVEESTMVSNNLQNLINSTDIGTIFLDRSLRIVLFTPAVRSVFNLIPADYGRSLSDITSRLQTNTLLEDAESVIQRLHTLEREAETTDDRTLLIRLSPYRTEEDRIQGIVISFVDITERKRSELAVRLSEQRLRITMETAIDYAIITMDPDRNVQGWSRGAERTFGYPESEMIGRSADIIFTPEDREAGAPQQEMEAARNEGFAPDERWHIRRDKARFYMSGVMRPIYDQNTITGYVKVARDMTLQKEAEETLRISEERYRAALQSAEMAAWDWDIPSDMVVWNDQHYHILGLQPDSLLKSPAYFMSFVHPDDSELVADTLRTAITDTGVYQAEFRIIREDTGNVHWMSGYGREVIRDDEGRITRMIGVMYDITRRKRVEEQKEEFIGIASHELKTPLSSIKAYSEILQDIFDEAGDDQSSGLMMKMQSQIDRLTNLVRALLDVTRIREGKMDIEKAPFDLNTLIRELVGEMQITTPIRLEYVDDAPALVVADRKAIAQVLGNLLSNAIKYARGTARIDIRLTRKPDGLVVCVQDYGIGMSEGVSRMIFERFFRAMNSGNTYPGLGLGLYIAAEIVRLHGGQIWVESKEKEGSTFCVSIPDRG